MCRHREQLQGRKEQGSLNSKSAAKEQRKLRPQHLYSKLFALQGRGASRGM